mgnify:CR=1 FL=1
MEKYENRQECPIGVFDSGVGGISVLRELVAQMPNENYIFFGDSKNAPYGTKTLEEVQKLTCADAEYLLSRGVKALVVACNTATSAAIRILREKYADMPVIGIEPALKPAVHAGGHPRVLVMATPMTLREEKFHALMQRFESDAEILRLPCPGLVEYVEQGVLEGAELEAFLANLFEPYQSHPVDCVVLGCTHYVFLRPLLREILPENVQVLDGNEGTARQLRRVLTENDLLCARETPGKITLETSGAPETVLPVMQRLLVRADTL